MLSLSCRFRLYAIMPFISHCFRVMLLIIDAAMLIIDYYFMPPTYFFRLICYIICHIYARCYDAFIDVISLTLITLMPFFFRY